MSVSSEWCTKKQTAKLIARTERTVSRIVREAVEKRTDDILNNLKLTYADGREIPGPNVTAELLAKNEEEGSRTRWYFRRLWWQDEFAPQFNENFYAGIDTTDPIPPEPEPSANRGVDEAAGEPPPLPSDPAVRAVVLEHLHYSDRKHIAEIKQLTDRVLQVVETNQQLQGQTNTLYNQFQEALKQSGGLKALVKGTPAAKAESAQHEGALSSDADVVVLDPQPQEERRTAPRTPNKRARPKPRSTAAKADANKDWFPTLRSFARYLTRK